VSLPIIVSMIIYVGWGLIFRNVKPEAENMLKALNEDE